ncbi:MAG: 1-deoxy-D-xylulose-5-phosphate reductoisomerase [Smithellaceae bacterium]|nr:1-deoxy-D-xylulose-5-phosphate reductoisomerase [Smithellaceae bacterium]
MKKLSVLGCTGSIGLNCLALAGRFPEHFQITALAAGSNVDLLKSQIEAFRPEVVSVIDAEAAKRLKCLLSPRARVEILHGPAGYKAAASHPNADLVVSAIVGAAGLLPTLAAIEAGKDVALANKETLVMAGSLVMELASRKGVRILPVDSEHSAIFQCLAGNDKSSVRRIILSASGGPFRELKTEELKNVTLGAALRHPNWTMGKKVTIDSASLMNKGLEVIEARWLFDIRIEQIEVLIHPQSIIHSMVEFEDGAIMAQLGVPDMKIPIAYAMSYPARLKEAGPAIELGQMATLEFYPPDLDRHPNLRLAYQAGRTGGAMPAVLNGANEVAVEEFIAGRIGFMDIPAIIESVLSLSIPRNPVEPLNVDDVIEADKWGRREAMELAKNYSRCSKGR